MVEVGAAKAQTLGGGERAKEMRPPGKVRGCRLVCSCDKEGDGSNRPILWFVSS